MWDFDGTIADTESIEYGSARQVFLDHGVDLAVEAWLPMVGTLVAPDWIGLLERTLGRDLDDGALTARRQEAKARLTAMLAPRPGVIELLDAAAAVPTPMAVCSNSPRRWVEGHLVRLGLRDRFATLVSVDDVLHGKPHPEPYATACRRLGADPSRSVAIEDSATGVASAAAAGLAVVAVPGPMSAGHDVSPADLVVPSLAELRLSDLTDLVERRCAA